MWWHVPAGGLIGALAAIGGIIFGIPGMAAAIVAVAVIGLIPRLPMLLAGGLVGLGATWLILLGRQSWLCDQPGQQCGATPIDVLPWLVFSAGIVLAGLLAGWLGFRRG